MRPVRYLPELRVTISAAFCAFFLVNPIADGLEPSAAIDDGFAVPAEGRLAEASYLFPGAEAFARGHFAAAAWSAPFGVEELAISTIHAGMSTGRFGLSLSYSGSGFELYGDDTEKIGAAYRIASFVSCGLKLTRNAMRIRGFGDADAWSADAGIVLHPHRSVFVAGSVEDIAGAELGYSREPLDGRVRFAASWAVADGVTLLASASKVRRFDVSVCGGCMVRLFHSMTVGIAGADEPDRTEFLVALPVSGLNFSYRGSYHRDLGMTHGFSLDWSGQGKRVSQEQR